LRFATSLSVFLIVSTLLSPVPCTAQNWPQAAGPNGTWRVPNGKPPVSWSVAKNQNILWRTTLPNGGQGGITVWGDRLFLTTFEEYKEGQPLFSAAILGHCLDAKTGKILWSVHLKGDNPSPMMYAYSDSTSWTPVTDGKHVWFFNSSGEMGCWDFKGKEVWRRKFLAPGEPFNKQCEPILSGNTIITVEPLTDEEHAAHTRQYGPAPVDPRAIHPLAAWHYLRGIDKNTGRTKWIAEDASTYYCTPVMDRLPDGTPAVLHGRGGPHDVPERPIGLSLTSLKPGEVGKTIWRYSPQAVSGGPLDGTTFQALYTMTWDPKYAYWFRHAPEESHLVFDAQTGKLLRTQSLVKDVDFRQWDPATQKYITHKNVNIRDVKELSERVKLGPGEVLHVFPNWHANLVVNGYHYFFTSTGHRRNGYAPPGQSGPSHCIGRVNVETGKVEYLEVPVSVVRAAGKPDEYVYGRAVNTKTNDYKGRNVAPEDRSRTDGWQIPAFFGSPIAVGDRLYMSTMLGITYVIDSKAPVMDEKALLAVNDLGPFGETWSLNSLSYSRGRLYNRSLKEVVCIGAK
jgi:hypothetical protein